MWEAGRGCCGLVLFLGWGGGHVGTYFIIAFETALLSFTVPLCGPNFIITNKRKQKVILFLRRISATQSLSDTIFFLESHIFWIGKFLSLSKILVFHDSRLIHDYQLSHHVCSL